ncbi:hypothetical protein JTL56_34730, partial [Pseudomonas aeruginosa]|nr:hypothetical protein [Pseudomonas aeruginosa]
MRDSFRAILETLGGTVQTGGRGRGAGAAAPAPVADPPMGAGGGIIHEVGCVRMGNNPRDSVLNAYCQAHDVRNLFVADGGPFVSHADK